MMAFPLAKQLIGRTVPRVKVAPSSLQNESSALFIALQSSLPRPTRPMETVTGMLENMDGLTKIVSTDKYGFNINGIHMRGSVICFNNFTLLWNCLRISDASPRNLAVVHTARPKPEVLIIGTGETMENINPALYGYFSRKGISVEPMATMHAIATFNVLMQEGRNAAAALVSRAPVPREEACLYTPDAKDVASLKHERMLTEALSGRATELAMLGAGAGAAQKLLDDGQGGLASAGIAPSPSAPQAGPGSLGSTAGSKQLAAATPTGMVHVSIPGVAGQMRAVEAQSLTVATKYGYPGALPPDVSPVRSRVDPLYGVQAPARPVIPRTTEEVMDAMARKGERKSGVQPPPGYDSSGKRK